MVQIVVIHNKPMNITERVLDNVAFECTSCNWVGFPEFLAILNDFSCCPICHEYDVRVKDKLLSITS
ncbi:hypothetical protein ACM9HF_20080 [Colwellia sp. RE-S-Sl-9]